MVRHDVLIVGTRYAGVPLAMLLARKGYKVLGVSDRTMPIFEYTLKAASLKDPASAVPIYRKVAQSDEETTRFMDVLAGNIPFKEFFNPASLARLLA